MANSTVEILLTDLVTEAQTIATPAYRNSPSIGTQLFTSADDVPSLPHIAVILNDEDIYARDANRESFSEYVEVGVFGYFESSGLATVDDANTLNAPGESLLHDVKKMLAGFIMKNKADKTRGYYHACSLGKRDGGDLIFHIQRWQASKSNKAMFSVSFVIQILTQDANFTPLS